MRLIQPLSFLTFIVGTLAQFQGEGTYVISSIQFSDQAITVSPADKSVILMKKNTTLLDEAQQWKVTIDRNTTDNQSTYYISNVKKAEEGYLLLTRANEKLFTSTTTKYGGADTFKLQQSIDRFTSVFTAYDYLYLFTYDQNVLGGISTVGGIPTNSSVKFAFEKVPPSS
ncbi:unnamed protein product [Cunninghamella blakesleeana]